MNYMTMDELLLKGKVPHWYTVGLLVLALGSVEVIVLLAP